MPVNSVEERSSDRYSTRVIGFGFAIIILLTLGVASATLMRLGRIQESVGEISRDHSRHVQLAHRMYHAARERSYLLVRISYEEDPFEVDRLIMDFNAQANQVVEARLELVKENLVPEERDLLDQQRQATADTVPLQEQAIERVIAGKRAEAEEWLTEKALPAQEQVLNALNRFIVLQNRQIAEASQVATEHNRLAILFLLGGMAVVTLLSVTIAWYVQRNMTRLMRGLTATSAQLRRSLGDLEFQKQALDQHAIVSIADRAGRITYVNDRFCTISQYSRSELIGSDHSIVNSHHHPKAFFVDMWRVIGAGQVWQGQVCNSRKDGSQYWVDTTILPVPDDQGLPYQYVSIRTDISAIKAAEAMLQFGKERLEEQVAQRTAELEERETVLRRITGSAQEAIIMVDHEDRITFWNAAAERLFGYSIEEILGQRLHPMLAPPDAQASHTAAFGQFVATGTGNLVDRTTELTARCRDGAELPVELALSAVQIKGHWCGIGIVRDISERKRAEQALQRLAETDTLTGIANRRKFDETLRVEMNRTQRYALPMSLMMLDIDHFKLVNDRYGHPVGDAVIVEFSRLISANIRAQDFFSRWGGEEFAILVTNNDCDDAKLLAEKLRRLVAEHVFPDVGQLTASLGLATCEPNETIESLVARADRALYQAKAGGRNRVVCL